MVSGTTWPDGDPFLQRQNEPSIAVSARNPLHLLAGANDYRTVDLPGLPQGKETGDAWLGVFRSVDGGGSWKSTLVQGYPQEHNSSSPLDGYEAAADPVVRAGTHGLFYYSGIVFDRSLLRSAAFVQRFMDLNNETVEPVRYIDTKVVASFDNSTAGPFIDKPWLETDIPRAGAQTVTLDVPQGTDTVSQAIPCGNVYMAWAEITGEGPDLRTQIMFSRSTDCGGSWSTPVPISVAGTVGQGATIAVAPATGRVYVAWRQFHLATVDCVQQKGYWKDSSSVWPVASLEVGGVSYTRAEALVILQQAYPPSDAPGILAQQLIAAKLNVFSGAENEAIEPVIEAADIWLVAHPLHSKPSSAEKQEGLALKDQLEAFNTGNGETPVCTAGATSYPDAILVVHSDDGGRTFSAPVQVATVSPFDQGTSEYSFRTNAYPTMAVDETGRAYLAWATRGLATYSSNPSPDPGDARIVVTTSNDGTVWTIPTPIDQPEVPGHQLFPSLTYNSGKLVLVYNDFRADVSGVFERFVVDLMDATHPMRHTVDVRAAVADPGDTPAFTDYSLLNPSSQVSRYPFIVTGTNESDMSSLQLQYNPPNLPMFQLGHAPFFGDYLDVAGAPRFVPNAGGTWSYNTALSTAPVYNAVWTDNRDVVGPADSDWANYIPPGQGHTSVFDGSTEVADCATTSGGADRTQMRNQNIYTARLVSGLFVAVPSNSRPLSTEFQRAFVIFVQNATQWAKPFRLEVMNQPAGGAASFEQFSSATIQDVTIGPYSSISQTVFVTSSNPAASVDVRVTETNCGSPCLQSTVRLNPDSTNPPPADTSLLAREVYNPAVLNPAVLNPAVLNPAVLNPAVLNPAVLNPAVLNYGVENPAVYNPAVLNPAVYNSALLDALNLMMTSMALLNPAVLNPAVLNPAVLNPAVLNPAVLNPAVLNPAVLNPAVYNPAVLNPAVLNPAVLNPAVYNTTLSDGSVTEANYIAQNAGNTTAAYSFNLNLASQQSGLSYQLMIYRLYFTPVANGCALTEAAHQELLVNDLDPNLNASLYDPTGGDSFFLNPGDVAIATLRVVPDPTSPTPGDPSKFNVEDLSASVVAKTVNTDDAANGDTQPPFAPLPGRNLSLNSLVFTSASLPSGVVGSPYSTLLAAAGGTGFYTWTAVGMLPPGLTLSSTGVLSGTPTVAGSFAFTIRVTDGVQLAQQPVTLNVTATAPPVATLAFSVQPADATGGQTMPSVAVQALDGTSSPVPGASITVALDSLGCSAATLSGPTTAVTDGTGVATFPGISIDRGGWGYTLTASATGNPAITITSNAFNVEGFCDTGSMGTGRSETSASLLSDGKVLFAGGTINPATAAATATAELFDPSANSGIGSFVATGSLNVARTRHATTLLADGRVLVAGGRTGSPGVALASAEIYDPATGTFALTGDMGAVRVFPSSTLLPDGRVLVSGGYNFGDPDAVGVIYSSAELFDPSGNSGAGSFAPTGSMSAVRHGHTATLLADGRVLVVGGQTTGSNVLASAEVYDPATGAFTPTGNLTTARAFHTATVMTDGRVLISGGSNLTGGGGGPLSSAEIYDPTTGAFTPTGGLNSARYGQTSTLLPDGRVLVCGGYNSPEGFLRSAEIYDPLAGAFELSGSMHFGRDFAGAAILSNGKVLIGGGNGGGMSTAELFFPLPPRIFIVTNTDDSGAGSLRQAIVDANAHPGRDEIRFAIPAAGVQIISPASPLPVITNPVVLDATTQPGYSGTPLIRLDGVSQAPTVTGIPLAASNSVVQGFMVTRFPGVGIDVIGSSGSHITRNFVGTDGTTDLGNGSQGISIKGGSANVVMDNVISANDSFGIDVTGGATNTVFGLNKVGTDVTGAFALGNADHGLVINASASGTVVRDNVISGNGNAGILIDAATGNTVQGNKIGTNAAGTAALGNGQQGINISGNSFGNLIGGPSASTANVISGNAEGVAISGLAHDNTVQGNHVGTDVAGTAAIGNTVAGLHVSGATDNTLRGNLVSGNSGNGIWVNYGASGTVVEGNRVGTNAAGTAALTNHGTGVNINDTGTTLTTVSTNLISGNFNCGLDIIGADHTTVVGNTIGTDVSGTFAVLNQEHGVGVSGGAHHNTIGGTIPADRNVISGNGITGITLTGTSANTVQGNLIGTNATGSGAIPNAGFGVWLGTTSGDSIGGTAPGAGNLVSGNGGGGVYLGTGVTGTVVAGNHIGTDLHGAVKVANAGHGLFVTNASGITIGGAVPEAGNLISGNANNGITLEIGATGVIVSNNRVGTNWTGAAPLGNAGDGVAIYNGAAGNTVADNVIAASTYNGIRINVASGNTIRHNWIGTNAALATGLGNEDQGISVEASTGTTIGGTNAGDGNVVAYNAQGGILLESAANSTQILANVVSGNTNNGIGVLDSQTVTISGNKIGTDPAGVAAWPNTGNGVLVSGAGTTGVTIGGSAPGAGNVIAYNGVSGIAHSGAEILSNSIFGNHVLGIDVGANGVTETGYPDGWFIPVIETAFDDGAKTVVAGHVIAGYGMGSPVHVPVRVQFFTDDTCDHGTYGEGKTLVGSADVDTVGSNITYADFTVSLPTGLVGKTLTATNTIFFLNGFIETYEFSACVTVGGSPLLWARQAGIGANDSAKAITSDASAMYVFGTTTGSFAGQQNLGGMAAFVRKYDSSGSEVWTRLFGGWGGITIMMTFASGIAVDASGVYVAGSTYGELPGQTAVGVWDAFIRKYDLDGNELWTRQFGTTDMDMVNGVVVDSSGVYVAGSTQGSLDQTNSGGSDAFVRKYDLDGNIVWTSQFGTTTNDQAYGISVDASGVYVTGDTAGAFPGLSNSGGVDTFVRKCDLDDGHAIWTQQFGSTGDDEARALSADVSGVYVTGYTPGAILGEMSLGGVDAFVRKYDADGNVVWTHQFGTGSDDHAYGISVDASGVYVTGSTAGAFPTLSNSGGVDTFVRKYNADGTVAWTSQFGTATDDHAYAISVGALGVLVGGDTDGALPGQASSAGTDAYVLRSDAGGSEVWTRQFGGGAQYVIPEGLSIDASGVYVSGSAVGVFPGHPNPGGIASFVRKVDFSGNEVWLFEPEGDTYGMVSDGSELYVTGQIFNYPGLSGSGDYDVFVDKLDLAGNEAWSRQFGTVGTDAFDWGFDVASGATGAYVSGRTQGTLPGQTSSGDWDAFIRRVDTAGNEVWTRQFGTSAWENARSIAIDSSGVYVTGGTQGAFAGETNSGSMDVYVRKYDLNGNLLWTREFGTAAYDYGWRIAVDASGVYVVGEVDAAEAIPGQSSSGGIDAFVRKYDSAGNLLWTRQFGSSGDDVAYGVSVDASGVYVTGWTTGVLPGQTSAGGTDVFVRKYDPAGTLLWTYQFGSAADDTGWRVRVDATGVYVSGETFGALPGQTSLGGGDLFMVNMVR